MITKLDRQLAGLEPFQGTDFMERSGNSLHLNWYDLSVNYNSLPYNYDTVILVTSHKGHLPWLKATLKQYFLDRKSVV